LLITGLDKLARLKLPVWFVIRFRIIQMILSLSQDVITVAESSSGLKLNI